MTQDVAAKVTSETSQRAELQGSVDLTVPAEADVKLVTKNIEDIEAGDLVLARDEHGSGIGLKPVKETYQRVSHHLRHLTFEAPNGTQQTLSTTDEHPFWSVTAEEFVEAGSLIVGHSVTGPNGQTQTLVSSAREEFSKGVPVFNFQVTEYHTYFVAASADKPVMLVHNANNFYSNDPHVANIANAIEAAYPGHVVGVNQMVGGSEVDILLKNAIIEVKGGNGKGLTKQILDRLNLGLPVIGHAPNLGPHAAKSINEAGGIASKSLQELIEVVAP
ncbi:MAG: polymorphic toxin-type HINT domain-containing protein [Planctomyces sp.]|jgi:hypothetical protein